MSTVLPVYLKRSWRNLWKDVVQLDNLSCDCETLALLEHVPSSEKVAFSVQQSLFSAPKAAFLSQRSLVSAHRVAL